MKNKDLETYDDLYLTILKIGRIDILPQLKRTGFLDTNV